jgi:hypothetical protein
VFRFTTWGEETKTLDLRKALYDLPLFKAAQDMISTAYQPHDDKIVVNPMAAAGELLSDIQPEALSVSAGIPLGRVQFALDQMKTGAATATMPTAASKDTPTERAILQYVLRQGATAQGRKPERSDGAEAVGTAEFARRSDRRLAQRSLRRCWRTTSRPKRRRPERVRPRTVRTSRIWRSQGSRDRARAPGWRLAARLDLADTLLANPTSSSSPIRPEDLYGNGAFALLCRIAPPLKRSYVGQKWFKWLQTLPLGRNAGLTSPADTKDGRGAYGAAVEDQSTKKQTAFINVLRDRVAMSLPDAAFESSHPPRRKSSCRCRSFNTRRVSGWPRRSPVLGRSPRVSKVSSLPGGAK